MHGGVKFYRGSAAAARTYVEADRSRVDDYYLAEGTGVAARYVADTISSSVDAGGHEGERAGERSAGIVRDGGTLDGYTYERWVGGFDVETDRPNGRLRTDEHALRFVEVVVNGPKTWSLAAALHPAVADAYDAAQERAAVEIIGWLAEHSTTRVGPRGRQVQVPVERLEAAVVRHYTSRAEDPHRHLHLQVNARVFAQGRWRGLHSVGVVDSIEAINGIGHAAVMCDPQLCQELAAQGYTLDPESGEVQELARYAGEFSARAAQIARNVDRYESAWRTEHPGEEPGPKLRRSWDRRAWSQARPDKVVPADGRELERRWVEELHDLGFTPPTAPVELRPTAVGRINRDAVTQVALSRLGAKRSSWNAADIRGEVEKLIASVNVITTPVVRRELVEDLTARTVAACEPLLERDDVPGHVRALTSRQVLDVEADLVDRLAARATTPGQSKPVGSVVARVQLDPAQQRTVSALAGTGRLVVVEGAAGAGKTTTLSAARELLAMQHQSLVVVTPTLKAAQVAGDELGTAAFSAAWLVHQHGFRWDDDGRWTRLDPEQTKPAAAEARLLPGDLLLIDEAGMLDQDTARALLTVADESGARVALVGDRHQLPAVGRGGVLDHATRWSHPDNQVTLDAVHRFADPAYADLTLLMRTGERPGEVFDKLLERGDVVIHSAEVERLAAVTTIAADSRGEHVIADTREQVAALNAAIRDRRLTDGDVASGAQVTTRGGAQVGAGDHIATRRNNRDLDVANRDQWTVTGITDDGDLLIEGRRGKRTLPAAYANTHVELSYATTVHGVQGETVDQAHLLIGESTGAASAYVGMTRGRQHNTAHLAADTVEDARTQWVAVFSRDRADLGPARAAETALEAIDRYGTLAHPRTENDAPAPQHGPRRPPPPTPGAPPVRPRSIGR